MPGLMEQPLPPQGTVQTPPQGNITPEPYDPQSLDNEMMNREQTDPSQLPPGQPVMTADASGEVPLPERPDESGGEIPGGAPPTPEPSPFRFVQPDDSRYKDPQNLLVADVVLGGSLAWLQAAADIAIGRVKPEDFDNARMEHQERIKALRDEHPDFVAAAEKAAPFVTGLIGGGMSKAGGAVASAAKGALAGGATGAVQGYTSGSIDEPSLSSERMGNAVGGAAKGAAAGGAAGAIPGGVQAGKEAIATRKATREAESSAAQAATDKAAATKARSDKAKAGANQRRMAKEEEANTQQLAGSYEQYKQMPQGPSVHWKENRQRFADDPQAAFAYQASHQPTLEAFSKTLNLPQSVIVERMIGKDISPANTAQRHLYDEIRKVYESRQAFQKVGSSSGKSMGSKSGGSSAPAADAKAISGRDAPANAKRPAAKPAAEPIKQFDKSSFRQRG